ncbi:MAG: hypothetical protein ACFFAN_10525 [Promethearchaeota archaeon]
MSCMWTKYKRSKLKNQSARVSVKELNDAIFEAIRELNAEGFKTTAKQISKYFEKNDIPKKAATGESLSTPHLRSLVSKGRLEIADGNTAFTVYVLIEDDKKEVDEKKLEDQEIRGGNKIEEETFDIKGSEKEQEIAEEEVLSWDTGELMVKCTSCGLYCKKEWGLCPDCGVPIPYEQEEVKIEEKVEQRAIPTGNKAIQRASQIPPLSLFCVSCGKQLSSSQSANSVQFKQCNECQQDPNLEIGEIKYCPSCGTLDKFRAEFCLKCYQALAFDPQTLDKSEQYESFDFYRKSVKLERNSRYLPAIAVHLAVILLFISQILSIPYLLTFLASLVLSGVFCALILFNKKLQSRLRKIRIANDLYYKVILGITFRYRQHLINITKGKFKDLGRKLGKKYGSAWRKVGELGKKIKKNEKKRVLLLKIFILLIVASVGVILLGPAPFFGYLTVCLFLLYPIVQKKYRQQVNEMFMAVPQPIGTETLEARLKHLESFAVYVNAYLYNLLAKNNSKKTNER